MDGFLGIEGVDHFGTHETHWTVETAVIATGRPACPNCGPHDRMESKGLAPRQRRLQGAHVVAPPPSLDATTAESAPAILRRRLLPATPTQPSVLMMAPGWFATSCQQR